MRVKLSLVLGGFSPFLSCPALFLRPSTVAVKKGIAGREKEREVGGGRNKFNISHSNTGHQANIDTFKQCPATEKYKNVF